MVKYRGFTIVVEWVPIPQRYYKADFVSTLVDPHQKKITCHSDSFPALRLAARTLLLVILATCRGAYVTLEQPANSRMRFFPDLTRTGQLILKYLGPFWGEQFLSAAQIDSCLLTLSTLWVKVWQNQKGAQFDPSYVPS